MRNALVLGLILGIWTGMAFAEPAMLWNKDTGENESEKSEPTPDPKPKKGRGGMFDKTADSPVAPKGERTWVDGWKLMMKGKFQIAEELLKEIGYSLEDKEATMGQKLLQRLEQVKEIKKLCLEKKFDDANKIIEAIANMGRYGAMVAILKERLEKCKETGNWPADE